MISVISGVKLYAADGLVNGTKCLIALVTKMGCDSIGAVVDIVLFLRCRILMQPLCLGMVPCLASGIGIRAIDQPPLVK